MNDPVNHPSHYTDGKYEVIDFIEQYDKLRNDFCFGNAFKYICRAGKKDPDKEQEDLKKAIWYLERWNEPDYMKKSRLYITIDDFLEDKNLDNTIKGLAIVLMLDGHISMAVNALRLAIKDVEKKQEDHEP